MFFGSNALVLKNLPNEKIRIRSGNIWVVIVALVFLETAEDDLGVSCYRTSA